MKKIKPTETEFITVRIKKETRDTILKYGKYSFGESFAAVAERLINTIARGKT